MFLEASKRYFAARQDAETEHSRCYVRLSATKYGRERPLRSPKDNFEIASIHAANTAALIKAMQWAVHDINAVRPHGDLKGLTPDECYFEITPEIPDLHEQRRIARAHRLAVNTATACGKCL